MSSYRETVEQALIARSGTPIYNASLEHAATIVEAMFAGANREIRIFTGRLNARVYGRTDVVDQAQLFLVDQNHRARILFEEDVEIEELKRHPLFMRIPSSSNIEVRRLDSAYGDLAYHMMLMDDDSYRFEPDKREPEAVAAFGNSEMTSHLGDIFETLWKSGKDVPVDQFCRTSR